MKQIFLCVLSLSLSGALTGMLILLIRPLTKKYFSKKWNYYIWMLLLARLMIPVYFELPYMELPYISNSGIYKEYQDDPVQEYETTAPDTEEYYEPKEQAMQEIIPSPDRRQSNALEPGQAAASTVIQPYTIVGVVWLLGVMIALLFLNIDYLGYYFRIKRTCRAVSDWQVMNLLEELSARLSLNGKWGWRSGKPKIYESPSVTGPVTLGLYKPVIILPKEEWDIDRLKMILHHELVHIKRKDLWIKWLYQILLCVHWFNPLLYLFGKKINADCELACDEAVLQELTEEGRKVYGNLLIDAAERNLGFAEHALSTSLLGRKGDLKERLHGILHYRKQTGFKVFLSGCVCAGVMFLSACGSVHTGDDVSVRVSGEDLSDQYVAVAEDFGESYTSYADQFGGFWDEVKGVGLISDGSNSLEQFLDRPITKVDEKGEAYRAYEDDALLAGEDVSDWENYYTYRGGEKIECSGMLLNGTHSVLVVYTEKETVIAVNSSFNLVDGRFKIIHAAPDGTVETVDDTGKPGIRKITLPEGRNVIKLVGQKSKLKELAVSYAGLDDKSVSYVYYGEQDEYAGYIEKAFGSGETIDKAKMMDAIYYLDAETVSKAFACLLEQGENFAGEELYEIFIYSDDELSSHYLLKAIDEGKVKPLDAETISELMPYLNDTARIELIMGMDDQLTFEALNEFAPYLSDEGMEQCLIRYIEAGNTLTYSQFDEISPYLNRSTVEKIDKLLNQ